MCKIKLAIADDQVLFLRGLKYILQDFDDIDLIIEVSNGQELLDAIPHNPPDVVLMDMKMPVMDGMEATKEIKKRYPNIKVILLSMFDDERLITHMMEIGANGYLLKNEEPHILKEAIDSVLNKDLYFNDYVSKALLKGLQQKTDIPPSFMSTNPALQLTPRELEVLRLICEELTTAEIAKKLYISARTVEGHRKNLLEKAGVRNTAGLVIFAVKNELIQL
ncbi:MAG: response regulator transcription factor [Bacteroidota bacterium]